MPERDAIMTNADGHLRVVAWTDGSDEAAHATDWAARHAAARALPLSVAQDGSRRPEPGLLDQGDILVTPPTGYLGMVEQTQLEEHAAARIPAPTVLVPDGAPPAAGAPRVLLLVGTHFFPAAAFFAFTAAADLGGALDVVRLPTAYDDDYGSGPEHGPYSVGPHLRAEVAKLRARFLGVAGDFRILPVRPWSALKDVTRGAQLAVLGVGAGCGVDVRAVYDLDTCPVAMVPEP